MLFVILTFMHINIKVKTKNKKKEIFIILFTNAIKKQIVMKS